MQLDETAGTHLVKLTCPAVVARVVALGRTDKKSEQSSGFIPASSRRYFEVPQST